MLHVGCLAASVGTEPETCVCDPRSQFLRTWFDSVLSYFSAPTLRHDQAHLLWTVHFWPGLLCR